MPEKPVNNFSAFLRLLIDSLEVELRDIATVKRRIETALDFT